MRLTKDAALVKFLTTILSGVNEIYPNKKAKRNDEKSRGSLVYRRTTIL